jgi:alkyl hydroperoxide reductase subunit AhpF
MKRKEERMGYLDDGARASVRDRFAELTGPVRIVNFTQEMECQFCRETRSLMEEVAALSDKIDVEVHDFAAEPEAAAELGVDRIPATVLVGDRDRGVRFLGIPAGYEFASLVEGIALVSSGDSGLSPASRDRLAALASPVHLQVFVTPT